MKKLTQGRLKELLYYDPDSGEFTWRVRRPDVKAGCDNGAGYVGIQIEGRQFKAHRLAWLYIYGYLPENQIDHIDRVRDNNRISNLREVSQQCNSRNSGNPKNNTSGVKGVSWEKSRGKWNTHIKIAGKHICLGYHDELSEAACHRLAAEQAEDWEGCDSSSPAFQYVQKIVEEVAK